MRNDARLLLGKMRHELLNDLLLGGPILVTSQVASSLHTDFVAMEIVTIVHCL
jgi:hypothetical protein